MDILKTCMQMRVSHQTPCRSYVKAYSGLSTQITCWLFLLSLSCAPGSKAAAVEYSTTMYQVGSPVSAAPLQVVRLAEDLKLALELQPNQEERESLRAQLPSETTHTLIHWLQNGEVSVHTSLVYCIPVHWHLRSAAFINLWSDLPEMSPFIHFPIVELLISESVLSSQKELHQKLREVFSAWVSSTKYIIFPSSTRSCLLHVTVVFVNAPVSQSVAPHFEKACTDLTVHAFSKCECM